ncbi:MAG TPA: EI24 domain-containing protein [Candidatus Sulfotelmatobacter sp.]|nr:EI24 domain-containing protein [Candidatus Sulfotelmatobacter sp.]
MLRAFSRAIEQLPDPAFRRVLLQSVGLTLLAYLVTGLGVVYGLHLVPPIHIPGFHWLLGIGTSLALALAMTFFFPTIASLFIGLFLDDIAEAAERRYYPGRPPGRMLSFGPAMLYSLGFTFLVVLLNLLVLPFYVLTLWFPIISFLLYYGLNGYILGRAYFELVAMRHLPVPAARKLRKAFRGRVFLAGVAVSFLLTLPVVNLLTPLLATAAMVHIFQEVNDIS